MPRPKRNVLATAEETLTPPPSLSETQAIACVVKATGNSLYSVKMPSGKILLVELPPRFRNTIWIKRGGYVLIDTKSSDDRDNKLNGDIVNVVRDEKEWRKEPYW
jgi:probable RNA-binding protein EIF1AD